MVSRVVVTGVREAEAAALALRTVDRDVKTQTTRALRAALPDIWSPANVARHARTRADRAVFNGTSVAASATRITLGAGAAPTIAPGVDLARAYEFGDPRKTVETYQRRSRKGGSHRVRRHTQNQLPPPVRRGRVVHPAAAEAVPRVVSLYVQTVIRTIYDALGGR